MRKPKCSIFWSSFSPCASMFHNFLHIRMPRPPCCWIHWIILSFMVHFLARLAQIVQLCIMSTSSTSKTGRVFVINFIISIRFSPFGVSMPVIFSTSSLVYLGRLFMLTPIVRAKIGEGARWNQIEKVSRVCKVDVYCYAALCFSECPFFFVCWESFPLQWKFHSI